MKETKSGGRRREGVASLVALVVLVSVFLPLCASAGDQALGAVASGTPVKKSWLQKNFSKPNWDDAARECATPRDVCRLVLKHVWYTEEPRDLWSGPQDTWMKGRGDCEDFAVCIQTLCKQLGFDATVQLFYPPKPGAEGHAMVIGNWNGKIWMSSNGAYNEIRSIDDAKKCASRLLWCDAKKMWSVPLKDDDVQRFIRCSEQIGAGTAASNASVN